jgi:hypothetical protein
MRVRPWALAESLLINLVLGLLVATALSVESPAQAAEPTHCATQRAAQPSRAPERASAPATHHRGYVVAARMGWAAG